ncbi:MAG: hypothetical protein HYY06_17460 [Deltaproteobacteria bacterium]|nr:hypothetical protein [Deltaproteobacteria bacterium]
MRSFAWLVVSIAIGACGGTQKLVCPDGEDPVDGQCRADAFCGAGTVPDDEGKCVPEAGGAQCGDGTSEVDGECVPNEDACAEGTTFDEESGECVLDEAACADGTRFDDDAGGCVPDEAACAPGTTFDPEAGECVPACPPGQLMDEEGQCVPPPECGLGTAIDPATGECLPVAVIDLTLETLCMRRAINLCGAIFDPECECEHAGDLYSGAGNRGGGSGGAGVERDDIACVGMEFAFCEVWGVALVRQLVDDGQATVRQNGLEAFDAHYRIDPGLCERPVGWERWPPALLLGLIDGEVGNGGECIDSLACAAGRVCAFDFSDNRMECRPRAVEGGECEGIWDQAMTRDTCVEGLRCWNSVCVDRGGGSPCNGNGDCGEGMTCRDNPDAGEWQCLPGLALDDECNAFDWEDRCGPDLYCDAERGQCAGANGDGGACDYCGEVRDPADPSLEPYRSSCLDDLRCILDGEQGSCAEMASVCPVSSTELYGIDGICEDGGYF